MKTKKMGPDDVAYAQTGAETSDMSIFFRDLENIFGNIKVAARKVLIRQPGCHLGCPFS